MKSKSDKMKFLGLELNNVLVAASSPVTESAENVIRCEQGGAGAVILKTASSHREHPDGRRICFFDETGFWAKSSFNREILPIADGVKLVSDCRKSVNIPVIASITNTTLNVELWLADCLRIADAGADALQLDLFYFEHLLSEPDFETRFIELLEKIRCEISVPIMPKLNIGLPAEWITPLLKRAGIKSVSLLDSIRSPAPAGQPELNGGGLSVFGHFMFPLTRYYTDVFVKSGFEVCAGGGVCNGKDATELLRLGATTVQLATEILLYGTERFSKIASELQTHTSLPQMEQQSTTKRSVHFISEGCSSCGACAEQMFCPNPPSIKQDAPCEGCGFCTFICPSNALVMSDTVQNEQQPFFSDVSSQKAGKLLQKIKTLKEQNSLTDFALDSVIQESRSLNESAKRWLDANLKLILTIQDVNDWKKLLDETLHHLESKAIDLHLLSQQIDKLKYGELNGFSLPPVVRLTWLTAKIANANHRGETNLPQMVLDEFATLSDRLFDENSRLVCWADLHLAVSYTNSFEFDKAERVLRNPKRNWEKLPIAVCGLNYYGRVLSSLGQIEAFNGNNEKTVDYFDRAIQTFSRIGNHVEAAAEIRHSRAYLLTALMDLPDTNGRLEWEMREYFCGLLSMMNWKQTIDKLCGSDEPSEKYAHHILLRYLVSNPDKAKQYAKQYVDGYTQWKTGEGHPWELIEFYRALLLNDQTSKKERLRSAMNIASQGGITLQCIQAVIMGCLLQYDVSIKDDYITLIEKLKTKVPSLGIMRFDILESQINCPLPPLELATKILPFNFR